MRSVIDELIDKRDPRGVLSRPVSADEAPDYLSLIHQPMDFGTIRQKLDEFEYRGMDEFERDLLLVVNNCTTYNKPGTYYFRLAVRVKKHIERLMGEARRQIERLPIDPKTGRMLVDIDMDIFALNSRVPEPPSPLQADTDSKALAPAETDPKEPSPAADNGSQAVVQADLPMTRSRSRTKAEEEAAPMTNGTSKAAPTNGHADGRPPKNMRGWAWVAEPADDVEDPRRLTLFEQLSVPPPDIRRSSRARRQTPDPSVPDDINVITTRLRKDSGKTQKRPHESPPPVEMAAPAKRAKTRHAQAMQQDVEYRPGTLVWAKMASYPWFPAEIVDPKSPRAPEEVHKDRHADSVALVCFFGASRSWKWVAGQHVCRLGVSMEDDRRLYKAKLSRSAGMAKNVRAAYAEACQSGGIEPLAP
ncbi:Bromodomain and PHD finger-containing protein 1 [Linderina pennispora]|nr:Bromodomain and PHD finger-containing protein 1 [Linderina pennispora]